MRPTTPPTVPAFLLILLAVGMAQAKTTLFEPFDQIPGASEPDNGLYKQNAPITGEENASVSGGRILGFQAGHPWEGSTNLPRIVADPEDPDQGGRLEFRGASDEIDRIVFRRFPHEDYFSTTYVAVDMQPSLSDPDALFLVAFSTPGGLERGKAFLDGGGYFGSFAIGFKGDGQGGMDLILRHRNGNLEDVDEVLKEAVEAGEKIRVVCRIDWNTLPPESNARETLTVWVNPGADGESAEAKHLNAYAGDPDTINVVYLLQRRFGGTLEDAVHIDNLTVSDEFPSLE